MSAQLFLKPNVVIEPLVDRWYAWSHLISPATAARNITHRHLRIMDSYIMAPAVHAAAVKNPKMRGGPFMDFNGGRLEDVKELRRITCDARKEMIGFSSAIGELSRLLKEHNKGYSLEELYEQVPDILKGYVELVYDLSHNPSFRFFESLLYDSIYYDVGSQSIALWITENDERPFCLSTPRLDEPGVLHLHIPFSSNVIDELSKMKRNAGDYNNVKNALGIKPEDETLFRTFFTDTPPPAYKKYAGDKIRMRYFGHASILVETKDVSILVDPLISYYGYQSDVSRFSDIDLPDKIDYVLITHNHQDHILFETLLPLRHKIGKIIVPGTRSGALQDPNLQLMFRHIGFNQVMELGEMEMIRFEDVQIRGIPFTGEHCDLDIKTKLCYHVKIGTFTLLFVADSRIVESQIYNHVHRVVGDVDVIFLGMECDGAPLSWLYGPLLEGNLSREHDHSRRLAGSDCEKGMSLVNVFNPSEVYVYAMGQEPWLEFISSLKYTDESNPIVQSNKLMAICESRNIISERLYGEKEILYSKDKVKVVETILN